MGGINEDDEVGMKGANLACDIFGRGAAFDKPPEHDGRGFGLFCVDQPFGLVEGGLCGIGGRFGLVRTGGGWGLGCRSCFAERGKSYEERHREGDAARAEMRGAGY